MGLDSGPRWAQRRRTGWATRWPPQARHTSGNAHAASAHSRHSQRWAATVATWRRRSARRKPIWPKLTAGASTTPRTCSQLANMSASILSVLFAPTIALRSRAESRLATTPIRHPASPTATDNGSHVPPVGSATTKLPAYGRNRSVNALIPAKVGGTLKSAFTPSPRIAT